MPQRNFLSFCFLSLFLGNLSALPGEPKGARPKMIPGAVKAMGKLGLALIYTEHAADKRDGKSYRNKITDAANLPIRQYYRFGEVAGCLKEGKPITVTFTKVGNRRYLPLEQREFEIEALAKRLFSKSCVGSDQFLAFAIGNTTDILDVWTIDQTRALKNIQPGVLTNKSLETTHPDWYQDHKDLSADIDTIGDFLEKKSKAEIADAERKRAQALADANEEQRKMDAILRKQRGRPSEVFDPTEGLLPQQK